MHLIEIKEWNEGSWRMREETWAPDYPMIRFGFLNLLINMEPSEGRIVNYKTAAGEKFAAIITKVWEGNTVNLIVFVDNGVGATQSVMTSVRQFPDENSEAGWAWPEIKNRIIRS